MGYGENNMCDKCATMFVCGLSLLHASDEQHTHDNPSADSLCKQFENVLVLHGPTTRTRGRDRRCEQREKEWDRARGIEQEGERRDEESEESRGGEGWRDTEIEVRQV